MCTHSVCRWVGHAWRVGRSWRAVKLARRAGVRGFSDTSCRAGSYTMKEKSLSGILKHLQPTAGSSANVTLS